MNKTISSQKYRNLLNWLKQSREAEGFSMRDLAQKLDTPHSFIQKIESGERRLDVYEFCLYCKALNIDPCKGIDLLC
jgi:transcriptional regulator with XRE-family HTH domain